MRPLELAEKHFGQFRVKGEELVPAVCPFCQGGEHHDKYTFAMNKHTGAYNCKRGSCGAQGSFRQLCEHLGEEADPPGGSHYEIRRPAVPVYRKPEIKLGDPESAVKAYLASRGISEATWRKRGVSEADGNIAFLYRQDGELVLLKFRRPRKVEPGERKMWREKGGKPVFWGMDDCQPDLPLVIVEGEMDALSLEECGIPNVVSVPGGAEDLACVDHCWDWLQRFRQVVIWPDTDSPGLEMSRKLIRHIGAWRCSVVQTDAKDANELLLKAGKQAVVEAVLSATEVPMAGLIRLADVKPFDLETAVRVRSSIPAINAIIGGYMEGQVSVWTGNSGSGKSTLLGQELLMAVNQGFRVCAFSGELPAAVFRYWTDLQAAGPGFVQAREDEVRKILGNQDTLVHHARPDVVPKIRAWYRNRFFLHDALGATSEEKLLEVFTYAAMRYDCKVFLVDNLMTTAFAGSERDIYHKQSQFVGRMVDFSHRHECHVHVVAHPRKTEGKLSRLDISGSGDITNRADNVFSLHRTPPEESRPGDPAATLTVLKNRFYGRQDAEVWLDFQPSCHRFVQRSVNADLKFGWQTAADVPDELAILGHEVDEEAPF
jgi:twinkle protein